MTIDEFFELLPKDGWELRGECGLIRRGLCCPVTAVHEARLPAHRWTEAATELGLEMSAAKRIVAAADGEDMPSVRLRRRLLTHCGLTER